MSSVFPGWFQQPALKRRIFNNVIYILPLGLTATPDSITLRETEPVTLPEAEVLLETHTNTHTLRRI